MLKILAAVKYAVIIIVFGYWSLLFLGHCIDQVSNVMLCIEPLKKDYDVKYEK